MWLQIILLPAFFDSAGANQSDELVLRQSRAAAVDAAVAVKRKRHWSDETRSPRDSRAASINSVSP